MAVARINKLELYVHKSIVDGVLASLQRTGSCEIIGREQDEGEQNPSVGKIQELDSFLSETRFLLRFLEPYYVDDVSPIARALGDRPARTLKDLACVAEKTDISSLAEQMRKLERRLVEIRSELSQIETTQNMLSSLGRFPYPLDLLSKGTDSIKGFLGTMPVDQLENWKIAVKTELAEDAEIYIADFGEKDKEVWVSLFYLRELETQAFDICSKHNLSKVDISSDLVDDVDKETRKLEKRTRKLLKEEKTIHSKAKIAAFKHVPQVRSLSDYWSILRSRTEVLESGEYTDQIVMLRAWVPTDSVEIVKSELAEYEELVEIVLSEPTETDEPPCILNNPKWAMPFETLTKLYGSPKYGAIDPTPLLAPFFFIFFGMCLGDGGYGLIMLGFFAFFLQKFKKMPSGTKQFFTLFVLSSVAAIIVGALTGSWLGDMVDAFPFLHFLKPLKDAPIVLNPMNDPMTFLAISLAFGVIQILFGLLVAFYDCLRKKDYIGAIGDQGGWLLLLVGLLLIGGTVSGKIPSGLSLYGKVLALAGAIILVLTQGREKEGIVQKAISGVLSLYNVTAYLGDVLSYSRLLALGLATSAIAMIINMLSTLAGGIPYVGWVIGIVLCVGGHLFSVAVNVLGAFVHSLRLQYVEFFSKFYTGGGRLFSPLEYSTNFVEITDTPKNS